MSARSNKCPHLRIIGLQTTLSEISRSKQGSPCTDCHINGLNFWICLYKNCGHVGCSEKDNNHSTKHFESQHSHCIHMNLLSQRTWCYLCETEVFIDCNTSINQKRNSVISNDSSDTNNTYRYSEKFSITDEGGGDSCESSCEEDESTRNIDRGGLVGLKNIANTCYMNAALQALSNSPALTGYFLDCGSLVDATAELTTSNQRKSGLAKNYHKLITEMWTNSRRGNGYLSPIGILTCIRNLHPMFRGCQQHDTQEFLRCFMDQLHEELKEVTPQPPEVLFDNNNKRNTYNKNIEPEPDYSAGSSPSQSEAEYETCDSDVSEQSRLSDEGCLSSQRNNNNLIIRSSSPMPNSKNSNMPNNSRNLSNSISGTNKQFQSKYKHSQLNLEKSKSSYHSIISDVFDGKLLSSVQCLTCNRISAREETFQDLSLPIPGKDHLAVIHQNHYGMSLQPPMQSTSSGVTCTDAVYQASQEGWFWWFWNWFKSWLWGPAVSLHDCMAAFFSADELKGDNMYSCEKCNKLRNGVKFSKVLELPEMLCVHLKRFRHDLSYSSKISSPVHFPVTGLDMRPYLHKDCGSKISTYDLTAVICHHGNVGSGHYTTFAKHEPSKRWYEYDDQLVTEISLEVVEACEAYVLFYRKSNSQMPLIRNEAIRITKSNSQQASDIRFFVSGKWLNRFNTFAEPGPIDNWALLCPHNALTPPKAALISRLVCPLPQPAWDYLYNKFGGGPVLNHLIECDICRRLAENLSNRQNRELHDFSIHNDEFQMEENHNTIYAISMAWFRQWQLFARGVTTEEPGPINNKCIAGPSDIVPIRPVKQGSDYAQINTKLWKFFHDIYGGGPEIILKGGPGAEIKSTKIEKQQEQHEQEHEENKSEITQIPSQQTSTVKVTPQPKPVNNITYPNSVQNEPIIPSILSTSSQHPIINNNYNPKPILNSSSTAKNVSFELNESDMTEESNSTSLNSESSQPSLVSTAIKRSKKDNNVKPLVNGNPQFSENQIVNKRDSKKYRGMKNTGLFGVEGKYFDVVNNIESNDQHSNNIDNNIDSINSKKTDEVMPLLHQSNINNNSYSNKIKLKEHKRDKEITGTIGGRGSNISSRKKMKKSIRKSKMMYDSDNSG